ncbi:MAG: MFS transporter [Planctomycetes bacterium]|nr:MFS transporter [Planctomycetota bacterium]
MTTTDNQPEKRSRWSNLARALKSRNYRLFFWGRSVSMIGTWMQRTALLWLVGTMYDDLRIASFWLGVVGFSGQIPALVLTPLAGGLADRCNRHRVIIITQILAMLQAFTLAGLAFSGAVEIWQVIALSVCLGAINAFDIPMRQAFISEMVDDPEDMGNAIALNSSMVNVGRLLGPAFGGMLAAISGPGICFLVNGLSFLAVIISLLMMRIKSREVAASQRRMYHHLAEGFRYTFKFPPICAIILIMSLVSISGIPYASLLPVFAGHVLDCGPKGYGLFVSGVGLGALGGGIYLASRPSVLGLGRIIALAPLLFGCALVAFSQSRSFTLSLMVTPLLGLGQMLLMASGNTVLQTIVDEDKRGRVMSLYALSFMGMVPLGNLIAGLVARYIGPTWTITAGGCICICGAILFSRKLPALREIVRPIYVSKGIIPEVADGLRSTSRF